jgi:ribosomal protein L11 methyltransferase
MPIDKITIQIAAVTAFGTGEYPTTNRCLIACQTFVDEKQHQYVSDVGCGSGILSIALAKLGARDICAYDCDQEAVRISCQNIQISRVEHQTKVLRNLGCEFSWHKHNFVTSNVLADPLISMRKSILSSLAEGETFVFSGFTTDHDSVLQKYVKNRIITQVQTRL